MTDNVITIVAAVADKTKVVFYLEDGTTKTIPQSDPRLARLIEKIMPMIERKEKVTISLEDYSLYDEFTKKTNAIVRFFKASRDKIAGITKSLDDLEKEFADTLEALNANEPEEVVNKDAEIPEPVVREPVKKPRYDDIKADLKPMSKDEPIAENETVVAIINGVAIPGVENLKSYIEYALIHNSPDAIIAFLTRISKVIDKRGHSIPDLMRFLERGDLPLANDGSIIGYKILRKRANNVFTYVDCHTSNVHQRVGTFVRVEEALVDKNRNNECSNGLHVARRGYIGSFSGDVCTIIKMAPEDVIAVPHNDPNKVRVCGYHIIGELSDHVYNVLRANRPMTSDPEAAELLANAISGNHIGILEEVWIGSARGGDLTIKNQVTDKKVKTKTEPKKVTKAVAFDDPSQHGVDPKELNKKIKEEKAKIIEENSMTILDQFKAALKGNLVLAEQLLEKKKKAKKSWISLGLPESAGIDLNHVIANPPKVEEPKAEPVKKSTGSLTNVDRAREMFNRKLFEDLKNLKKKAKVSWEKLGFTPKEIEIINK